MTAIVVGASSGLGRALATELAAAGRDLLLVASDQRDLEALAADLELRHGVRAGCIAIDLAREIDPGRRILEALGEGGADALLLAAGQSRGDDELALPPPATGQLLAVNLHAPLAIAQELLPMLVAKRGVIVFFGSIAAARGRRRNAVYAAAKRGLVSFHESLRQRHAPRELRVQLYELGFIASNLSFGTALPLAPAEPAQLARYVVRNLGRGSFRRYLPRHFALVAGVLRCLPWWLYRRMRA